MLCNHLYLASSGLNEEQNQIYKMALNFALQEMRPQMAEWDEKVINFDFLNYLLVLVSYFISIIYILYICIQYRKFSLLKQ